MASHVRQEENFPADFAVSLAGVAEVVADLEGAGVVRLVLERCWFVLLWLDTG